ncbi:Imm1 family immunity protein [Kribbella sp. NPDC056345]|uniref:Imm1 family immunity protein n=1 Tax=Kribbella sp. NPDC056345 TaxID=3345789 RepID=UPI0035E2F89E
MTATVRAFYKNGAGPTLLNSAADVDALVEAALAEPFENSVVALYSEARPLLESGVRDHELRVGIDAEAKVGGIRYAGDDGAVRGVWYVQGRPSQRDEAFYYYQGHDEGWPMDSEVSLDDVRRALGEFVESGGGRPASFEWAAWPRDIA